MFGGNRACISVLCQKATRHRAHTQAFGMAVGKAGGNQQPQIFLGRDNVARRIIGPGRDNHLCKQFGNRFGGGRIQRAVHGNNAAKR